MMVKYYVQSTGRYLASREKINGERLLHRQVWVKHNGKIPKGYDIHHIDDDWTNNDISNLEVILKKYHAREHLVKRLNNPEQRKILDAGLEKAREAAKDWHSSPEGIEWHKKNGIAAWSSRQPSKVKCQKCGGEFETYWPEKAKYCSKSCSMSVYFKTYSTDKRTCAYCGKEFLANRHRTTACCSRSCANKKRAAEMA
jgi:hypothetical protein